MRAAEPAPPSTTDGGASVMTNPRADRVRALSRLHGRAARRRTGTFLAEGAPSVAAALDRALSRTRAGAPPGVSDLLLTDDAAHRHPELVAAARAAAVTVRRVSSEVLVAVADATTPQGVVAVCEDVTVPLEEAITDVAGGIDRQVAVLVGAQDPGNAGTVIRSADAAGASAVVLTAGSVDALSPKCVRSAAGSTFHLDVVQGPGLDDVVERARSHGLTVLAADGGLDAPSHDLDDLLDEAAGGGGLLLESVLWLFGNEARGLTPAERGAADAVVRIPVHGRAESLNLASAATLCLYAAARAHRRPPHAALTPPPITPSPPAG